MGNQIELTCSVVSGSVVVGLAGSCKDSSKYVACRDVKGHIDLREILIIPAGPPLGVLC
jgi:hypothetical protein